MRRSLPTWWLLLFGVELMLVGRLRLDEAVVAAAIALFATAVSAAAVRAFNLPSRRPGFVRALRWLPVDLVTDSARLLAQLVRPRPDHAGRERELGIPPDARCTAEDRLSHAVLVVSVSPGTYVAAVGEDEAELRLHTRVPPGRIERELDGGRR